MRWKRAGYRDAGALRRAEKGRKIRMMLMLNGQLAQKTALVLSYDEQAAVLQLGQRKQPVAVPLSDILGCDYARGDSGEE